MLKPLRIQRRRTSALKAAGLCARRCLALWAVLWLGTWLAPAARAQITLDGRIDAAEIGSANAGRYTLLGTFSPPHVSNDGFGNWGLLRLYAANTSTKVYLAVVGTAEANGNTLQLFLDLPNLTNGVPVGSPLPGGLSGSGTSFENNRARLDLTADLGIALRGAAGGYVPQVVGYNGAAAAGSDRILSPAVPTTGAAVTMSSTLTSTAPYSRFAGMRMAYLNTPSGDITTNTGNYGWEVELDRAALGNPTNGAVMRVMAAYVNFDGSYYSSDVIPEVPGNGNTNLGPAPNFNNLAGTQAAGYTLTAPASTTQALNYNANGGQFLSTPYTDLGTSGTLISTANRDNANSAAQNIGFTFNYNGQSFSQFVLNTNGFIRLGSAPPSSAALYYDGPQLTTGGLFNSTSPADVDLISPFGHNLNSGTSTAEYRVATTGTAPNRVCTIQWKNVSDVLVDATTGKQYNALQFQVKLYETSNIIDFVYGAGTAGPGPDAFKTAAVGLKGSGVNADQMVTVTKNSTQTWSAASFLDGNYVNNTFNFRSSVLPTPGATYRFRPAFASDAAVQEIYTQAKLAIPFGAPHTVQAVVTNEGTSALTAVPITLTVSGANSFTNTKQIASLPVGATVVVTFDPYTPTTLGTNTVAVTLQADDDASDNTLSVTQLVTNNASAYADLSQTPVTSVGFTGGAGIIVARYTSNTTRTVKSVSLTIGTDANNVGGSVYGVVLDAAGNLLGRTADYTIQSGDLGTTKTFTFATPVSVSGTYLAGVGQNATGAAYYPYGFQAERPVRTNTFFSLVSPGSVQNDLSSSDFGRPMIEATMSGVTLNSSVASVCAGGSGTLTLTDYAGSTFSRYQANTGSGYVDVAGNNPTYTFTNLTTTTTFRAVTVTNLGQIVYSNPVTVTVLPRPTATLTATSPVTFCGPGALSLSATPVTGATYQYLFNGNPISGATSATYSATVTGSGLYSVVVTNANGCAATSAVIQVTVNPLPTPSLTAGSATTFCQGGSVTLTAAGGAVGATYQFLLNGSPISGATGTTYAASAAGNYTVTVTNTTGCSATSSAVAVTVNPLTTATFAYGTGAYCVSGTNPTPTVTGTTGGSFSSAAGLSLNAASGQINLAASTPGTYSVTYSVGGPCPSTSTQTVVINAAPTAGFSYPATSICSSATGTSTPTLAAGATAGTFSSTAGLTLNATTGAINPSTSTPGTYTVTNTIAAANGCAQVTATTQVTILPPPTAGLTAGSATTFCQGGSVTLTATGGVAYQFLLNGSPISGATGATYVASAAGNYTVLVTNADGCSAASSAVAVTVNPLTTATFAYGTGAYCVSGTNPTPTVTGTTGGSFSSAAGLSLNATTGAINLAASTPGTYSVTYSVGGPCPSTSTQTVVINTAPTAGFSYPATSICSSATGTSAPALATGATAGTFSSTSGLSINATTGVITPSTSTPGTYTVTNTIAAANGCAQVTATTQVTIEAAPTVTVSAAGPTTFCQGGSVTLTATGGTSYLWSNGATTASITVSASGSYSVTATNAAGCTATSSTTTVTVNPNTSAAFSYAGATFCQSGTNPVPTVTGTTGGTFSSTSGLSIDPATGAINLAASALGTYTVTYSVSSPTCPSSSTFSVTVTSAPLASFSYAAPSYCATSTSAAPAFGTGASGGTFSSTAGLTINATTGVINPSTSTPGTYTVTNTIAASGGCAAATATTTVTITAAPLASFGYANARYCAGVTTAPTPTAATGATLGTFSSTTGLTLNATTGAIDLTSSQPGTYTVTNTVAASGTCAAVTATTTVIIEAAPVRPTITVTYNGATTTLTSSATTGNQWYLNGTPVTGATGQTYVVNSTAQLGSYTVVVTNAAGCASLPSAPLVVTSTTKPLAGTALNIFPNPTTDGLLTVELTGYHKAVQLTVLDATGRLVYQRLLAPGGAAVQRQVLDLAHLPVGVYVLRAQTEGGSDVRRIVRK